ncbi:hypothetical protein [Arachnia propionica]|uniref:YhgE/Pip domain-containing protein n=1 Tax=Arachnia propionica TaxID=1750 RepID=A0A3P1WZV2_9ACTN|nr:hypothetical protein [Arachnia propionica]RRD49963.1 hypothetical protein EII35_06245 [Arachnia propionica]
MRPESMHPGHRLGWRAIAAMTLLPLVAVAMLLGVGRGSERRAVQAAVVNLDKAVTIDGQVVPLGRQLAAEIVARDEEGISWTLADAEDGRAGLAEGRYAAVVTIPEEFSEAATSFSENKAVIARHATVQVTVSANSAVNDAALAREVAGIATDTINATVTKSYLENVYVGFNTLGEQFTQVVDGVSTLDDGAAALSGGVSDAATGAEELTTGLDTLAGKGDELSSGAGKLSDGASQLSDGAGALAEGADTLADGTGDLADGSRQLADGASSLASGSDDLAAGSRQLSDGASSLASGVNQFDQGVQQLNEKAPKLTEGVTALTTGAEAVLGAVPDYTAGAGAAVDGVGQLRDGLVVLDDGLKGKLDADAMAKLQTLMDELVPALKEARGAFTVYFPDRDPATVTYEELAADVQRLDERLTALEATVDAVAEGSAPTPPEVEELAKRIISEWQCPVTDPDQCQQLGQIYAQGVIDGMGKGIRYGAGIVRDELRRKDPRTGMTPLESVRALSGLALRIAKPALGIRDLLGKDLPDGADPLDVLQALPTTIQTAVTELVDGVGKLRSGADELATKAAPLKENGPALSEGATTLLEGIRTLGTETAALPAGTQALANGSSRLNEGASSLARGAGDLADGAGTLASGAGKLSNGVSTAADGAAALSAGADRLSSGAGELAAGAKELSGGASSLADGTVQYVDGVSQAGRGAAQLGQGLIRLSDGATALAAGVDRLHTELSGAASELPTFSDSDIDTLAGVVASPIERTGGLAAPAMVPITALLAVAALWLGALLAYAFAAPVPSDLVTSSRTSATLWLRTLGVPTLIGAGQGLVIGLVAGMVLQLPLGRTLGAAALLGLVGASFVLVNHALAGWLGNLGRGVSALLLVLTVGLGLTSAVPGLLTQVAAWSPLHNGLLLVRTWLSHGSGLVGLGGGALLFAAIALACSYLAIAARRRLTADQFRARQVEA